MAPSVPHAPGARTTLTNDESNQHNYFLLTRRKWKWESVSIARACRERREKTLPYRSITNVTWVDEGVDKSKRNGGEELEKNEICPT